MQKNIFPALLTLASYCFLTSCTAPSPQQYFEQAVLNTNMMTGFANEGMQRELDEPSITLVAGTRDQTRSLKRKEIIDSKIRYTEEKVDILKDLKETAETREMLQTSITLNDYILSVYKNEYQQLAKLYDDGASKETTTTFNQAIHDKYFGKFNELFTKLTGIGKEYAVKNDIKVTWLN